MSAPLSCDPAYIGLRFRTVREQRGLTQPELAACAGVSPPTVRAVERGARLPNLYTAVQLCNALGVSLTEILRRETGKDVTL